MQATSNAKRKSDSPLSATSEGYPTPAMATVGAGDVLNLQLNLSDVPVPQRRFCPDALIIRKSDSGYHVGFVQKSFCGGAPRAVLDIFYSTSVAEQFARTLGGLQVGAPGPILETLDGEPAEYACLAATFTRVVHNVAAPVIDFYYSSSLSFNQIRKSNRLYVEPVARITPSEQVFAAFVEYFRALIGDNDGGV